MQKEIIAAIAAYLERETKVTGFRNDRHRVEFGGSINHGHFTHTGFCQEIAEEIAAAIAPLVEARENKNLEEAKTIVVKVAASLVRSQACEYAEDLNLPKTTPITAARKFEHEARVWNDTNRLRAIELKRAYDLMK